MNNCDNETIISAVEKALKYKTHFYAYRMPGESQLHFGAQIIDQHTPIGFYIHPFSESVDSPYCYISAQFDAVKFLRLPVSALPVENRHSINVESTQKNDYLAQARKCIEAMKNGDFKKLVLSRVIAADYTGISWTGIFKSLLDNNPDAFVFIYNCEDSGAWIGASPERYLSFHIKDVSTMALAGTRPVGTVADWGAKEINEQAIVADYISDKLTEAKISFEKSELYTRRAGNVEHLCNDFAGSVTRPSQVDNMRNMLHPTPALAGMPTKEALKYLRNTELHNRRYYGGYVGPIDAWGNFDFFVNLRSLEFDDNRYCIYVGGGLTSDSNPEAEWQETEQKSELLRNLL